MVEEEPKVDVALQDEDEDDNVQVVDFGKTKKKKKKKAKEGKQAVKLSANEDSCKSIVSKLADLSS